MTDAGPGSVIYGPRQIPHAFTVNSEEARVLLFFGTSGDMDYVNGRIEGEGFARETIAMRSLVRNGLTVTYSTQRLTL